MQAGGGLARAKRDAQHRRFPSRLVGVRDDVPLRPCLGCPTLVAGWTYCRKCRRRLRHGVSLPEGDGMTFDDVICVRGTLQRRSTGRRRRRG